MAVPPGISIAFEDEWNEPDPTWTRLDTTYAVTGVTTNRGRVGELEKTGTGTAVISLVDKTGAFDPTVSLPLCLPLQQAAIALQNPATAAWSYRFRGFVERVTWVPYQHERFANVTIELIDGLGLLAAAEMTTDGTFPTTGEFIVFEQQDFTDGVQRRIGDIINYTGLLDTFGWPTSMREINTGNVWLQEARYANGTSYLAPIQDAVDAEFPGVANFFAGKDGNLVFHGRKARFDPTNPDYDIITWLLGDDAAVLASPGTVARLSPPLEPFVGMDDLYTAALAIPDDRTGKFTAADIAAQTVTDAGAIAIYGTRTWSAEGLLTGAEDTAGSTTELEATKIFAQYIVDNYATPQTRLNTVTVKGQRYQTTAGATTWAFLCGVDISDRVHVSSTWVGGDGLDDYFFVEGIREVFSPMTAQQWEVETTLDLSPATFYSVDPF